MIKCKINNAHMLIQIESMGSKNRISSKIHVYVEVDEVCMHAKFSMQGPSGFRDFGLFHFPISNNIII